MKVVVRSKSSSNGRGRNNGKTSGASSGASIKIRVGSKGPTRSMTSRSYSSGNGYSSNRQVSSLMNMIRNPNTKRGG